MYTVHVKSDPERTVGPARAAQAEALDPLAIEAFFELAKTIRGLRQLATMKRPPWRERLRQAGLAPRHLGVLVRVGLLGPITVGELADKLGLELSTTSLLVSQLSRAKLLERHEDDADHRRTIVTLTPDEPAIGLFADLRASFLGPMQRAISALGPNEQQSFLSGLHHLANELQSVVAAQGARPVESEVLA